MGTRHVVASGHYLASQAGFLVLEAGGNAVDAGVATGLALNVLEPQMCCFAGVAPTVLYFGKTGQVLTIDGLGTWPQGATCDFFRQHHPGPIPEGILQTVVPAAPDAWITMLETYGTISFGDAAAAAIRFARDGFPLHAQMAGRTAECRADFEHQSELADIFLPGGRVPQPGQIFVQTDLAGTLQYLVDEEKKAAGKGREAGLRAVRDAFYRGDIAATIVRFHQENGGLMTMDDMAGYRVTVEPPVHTQFRDIDVYACGPWCQGPMMLQQLNLVSGFDLEAMGHNSTAYIHCLTEAIKLSAADREGYYGDPKFVDVPMDALLSRPYAEERRKSISLDSASPEMPLPGEVGGGKEPYRGLDATWPEENETAPATATADTTYLCVVDKDGNAFSCTPSDGVMRKSPVIPGTGLVPSGRGNQSRTDPEHPACVAPGKRPRLTPNPALAVRPGKEVMPFGTPGGDHQTQGMLQAFLNMYVFGMHPQQALEAPRFTSESFPDSFAPHAYYPGRLVLEEKIDEAVRAGLTALGHRISEAPHTEWSRWGVCAIRADTQTGVLYGAADSRRTCYALGW